MQKELNNFKNLLLVQKPEQPQQVEELIRSLEHMASMIGSPLVLNLMKKFTEALENPALLPEAEISYQKIINAYKNEQFIKPRDFNKFTYRGDKQDHERFDEYKLKEHEMKVHFGITGVGLTGSVLLLALTPLFPPSALLSLSFAIGIAIYDGINLPLTGSLTLDHHSSLHKHFAFQLKLFRQVANQLGLLPAKPSPQNDKSPLITNPSTSPYTLYSFPKSLVSCCLPKSNLKGEKTPIFETPGVNTNYSINR